MQNISAFFISLFKLNFNTLHVMEKTSILEYHNGGMTKEGYESL